MMMILLIQLKNKNYKNKVHLQIIKDIKKCQ